MLQERYDLPVQAMRHIEEPVSSATRRAPSLATATPTGRPKTLFSINKRWERVMEERKEDKIHKKQADVWKLARRNRGEGKGKERK